MRKTAEGRGKLQEARAKQEQLNEARQTVQALQLAVQAGQQQVCHFVCLQLLCVVYILAVYETLEQANLT